MLLARNRVEMSGDSQSFTITYLVSCNIAMTDNVLSEAQIGLLKDDLRLSVQSDKMMLRLISHGSIKKAKKLRILSNHQLKQIYKFYVRTYSNKKKDELVETVKLGPVMSQCITEVEKC